MQRYISRELTHFVGKGLGRDDQFQLLCNILNSGWLTHPPHSPNISGNLSVTRGTALSSNVMYSPQVVCFCDVPVADLGIHVKKYSPCAIAFSKDFLQQQGASPVFYVPRGAVVRLLDPTQSPMPRVESDEDWQRYVASLWKSVTKARHFDAMTEKLRDVLNVWRVHEPPKDRQDLEKYFREMSQQMDQERETTEVDRWLLFHIFSYMKFFDTTLADDHPDNYYSEREWRTIGNVQFSPEDVVRVCFPGEYSRRFRVGVPDYFGQITFLDEGT